MKCKIILSSEINENDYTKYYMRECLGVIFICKDHILVYNLNANILDNIENDIYSNINIHNIDKYGEIVTKITNYKGYWSYAIYKGSDPFINGENLLVALSDSEYIMITGGYQGPYINKFKINDIITECVYTVCSGGDPGVIFALSDKYIYTTFYPENLCIKRDSIFEQNNSNINIGDIIDLYLTYRGTPTIGFGYELIDINNSVYIYDIEEKPLEIKKIKHLNINGNYKQYKKLYINTKINKYPLLNDNMIYIILYKLSLQIISGQENYYKSLEDCLINLFKNIDNDSYEYNRFNNISTKVNLYDMFQDICNKLNIINKLNKLNTNINNNLNCKNHLIEFIKCYTNNKIICEFIKNN